MALSESSEQLERFRGQYFQLLELELLDWPQARFLKSADVQEWMYRNLFDRDALQYPPPERYQLRVLKQLVPRIEQAIDDPDEDV